MLGDFRRLDDAPLRGPSEGPRGWMVGVGVLLSILGLAAVTVAQTTYPDWFGPNDARMGKHPAFLWVPGVVVLFGGIALFAWGCWRSAHAD